MAYDHHPFTLRQLQYALAVSDLLSFRRAAERCHVSQPSLSAQLAQLEDSIGVRLFERDRRRVLLTPAGEEVLVRARRILLEADDLVTVARRASDPMDGTLRLGVIPTVSPYLLPHITPAMRMRYPALIPVWVEDKTEALLAALDRGALEAALVALEAPLGDVEHEVLATDPFLLAARPDHPLLAQEEPIRLDDLREAEVLLLDDGHCFREQALAFCAHAQARELAFRATSLSTLAQMVRGGSGITLLPQLAVPTEAQRADLRVRRFAEPEPARTIALVWRRRSPITGALRRLAQVMAHAWPPS